MYSELDPCIMLAITRAEHRERLVQAERRMLLRQGQTRQAAPQHRRLPRPQEYLRRMYLWYLGRRRRPLQASLLRPTKGFHTRVENTQGIRACRVAE